MSHFPNDREFAEILVERHENALLAGGAPEDLFVARIRLPFTGPNDVMTTGSELDLSATPDARIQKHLHLGFSRSSFDGEWLDPLVAHDLPCIRQASLNVFLLQEGIAFQDRVD